jgi:hypothetical protein
MNKWILALLTLACTAHAGRSILEFTAQTPTHISVPANGTRVIQYTVTNQSRKTHTLTMNTIQGITQDTSGNNCKNPFTLDYLQSCTLKLNVPGNQLTTNITGGPLVCDLGIQNLQCYQPSTNNQLNITLAPAVTTAIITITGSPLTLATNGAEGTITVNNTSIDLAATNVTAQFNSTALNGNVTVNDNNCTSIPALGSCNLRFTASSTAVPATSFNIQGTNTNAVSASITIQSTLTLTSVTLNSGSASGGLGVTLSGTGLSGATGVTFGGIAATSVNVVNSTTVTAVTPRRPAGQGAVNVVVTTPSGTATLANGFTYQTTAVGQSAYGGKIACLNGGLNNLIAATADNSSGIVWGGYGTSTGATSNDNGASNTAAIVACLTGPGGGGGCPNNIDARTYAAGICRNFAVDSQGNTPCQTGNTCYNDWFLPAGNNSQLNCLYTNRVDIGGFSSVGYWSSTEDSTNFAFYQSFSNRVQSNASKNDTLRVRCVRAFTP